MAHADVRWRQPRLLGPGLEAIQVRYLPALEALHRYLEEQPE